MKTDYVINNETVVMMSIDDSCCMVYEKDCSFKIENNILNILKESCNYFGSSFSGRIEGSKYILNYNYKLPIIVDESREIIVFPIHGYDSLNNCIICANQILNYEKVKDGIIIYLENGNKIKINESFGIFENQYLKSLNLLNILRKRKNPIK